jgi:hypothetical protein
VLARFLNYAEVRDYDAIAYNSIKQVSDTLFVAHCNEDVPLARIVNEGTFRHESERLAVRAPKQLHRFQVLGSLIDHFHGNHIRTL